MSENLKISSYKIIKFLHFPAYYNTEFRDSKKHIQQQIITLEKDPDRDVRDNVFSAFSEKEKTESPSSDEISDDLPAPEPAVISNIEIVESPPPPAPFEVEIDEAET